MDSVNTYSYKSKNKKSRLKLVSWRLCLLVLVGLITICVGWYFLQRFHSSADKVIFHSQLPYQAVIVPFQLKNNLISCDANFAGKKEDCILDTGSPAIIWPRSADLPGKRTLSWGFAKDGLGNQVNLTEYVLSSIKIGSYELLRVPTLAVSGNLSSSHSYPDLRQVCDLGNTAFSQAVMTIDYKKHVLILRNSQYDLMQHCPKHCFILPFQRQSKTHQALDFGHLTVAAETSGHPLAVVVDTGDASPATSLTDSYYKTHLAGDKIRNNWLQKTAFGETKADWIPSFPISVPDARPNMPSLVVNQPAVLMPDQHDGSDAIIGYSVLRNYLVTIDYPRRRIFLEPH